MSKREINWVVVFWIGVAIIFFWLLARTLGFFHTPLIIQLIPYFGGAITLLGMAKSVGSIVQKLDRALVDISEIKIELKEVRRDIHRLDKRTSILETRMGALELRIGA